MFVDVDADVERFSAAEHDQRLARRHADELARADVDLQDPAGNQCPDDKAVELGPGLIPLSAGLLDCRARAVTDAMKIAAAQAIASIVSKTELHEEYIIPSVFNKRVAPAVAREVIRAAHQGGVARRRRRPSHHS